MTRPIPPGGPPLHSLRTVRYPVSLPARQWPPHQHMRRMRTRNESHCVETISSAPRAASLDATSPLPDQRTTRPQPDRPARARAPARWQTGTGRRRLAQWQHERGAGAQPRTLSRCDAAGAWIDHASGEGGDLVSILAEREGSIAAAAAWLQREGYLPPDTTTPAPSTPASAPSPSNRVIIDGRQTEPTQRWVYHRADGTIHAWASAL